MLVDTDEETQNRFIFLQNLEETKSSLISGVNENT